MTRLAIKRGDVVRVDLRGAEGGEKIGERPCIVVQNDKGNAVSPLTIVVPLTDAVQYKKLPVQVPISALDLGKEFKDSVAECGHVRCIDRDVRIISSKVLTRVPLDVMSKVDTAIRVSLGL